MTGFSWRDGVCAQLDAAGIPYEKDAVLSPLTTFRIGGAAALLCRPQDAAQMRGALRLLAEAGVRHYTLGRGSNTLFADEGYDGAVICTGQLGGVTVDGTDVTAGAGVSLAELCKAAQAAGLAGLEFAYGIPGAVGGAVYMNAGAYGGEMKDVVRTVRCFDAAAEEQMLTAAECAFSYRHSIFEENGGTVLEASFALHPDDPAAIAARMTELAARRKAKQPLEWPSAGSTFKRPQGAFAAALIEQCGLKGMTVGGAAVSTKHAGFVINTGGATCADVISLTDQVAAIVKEKTGFVLEREIRVVR